MMTAPPTGAATGPSVWTRPMATRASAPRASGRAEGLRGRQQRVGGWGAQATLALHVHGVFISQSFLTPSKSQSRHC